MDKKKVEQIVKTLPHALKNFATYFKDNFDETGQETLSKTTGTIGVLIRLFGQSAIDSYFEKLTKEKLKDFGANIYLKA